MFYEYFRKIAFLRDAESVHDTVLNRLEKMQRSAAGRRIIRMAAAGISSQPVNVLGQRFKHPLGIAAGFDKDARVVPALQELGFAFVEVGTVTPRPQPGNPKPRIWRFPEAEALVNALGFPGEGMEIVGQRLRSLRESGLLRIPVGINIGKNAKTPVADAIRDYRSVFDHLYEWGDYFVVNVSSPNTPGLRDMQAIEMLKPLLSDLAETNAARKGKPLLIKIAPDLADEDVAAIGRLVRELNLAGIVAGNTTVRRDLVPRASAIGCGGLSGTPQFPRTVELVKILRGELAERQAVIAAGGISSRERLRHILACGANLAQVYTSFIYLGPCCVRKLLKP